MDINKLISINCKTFVKRSHNICFQWSVRRGIQKQPLLAETALYLLVVGTYRHSNTLLHVASNTYTPAPAAAFNQQHKPHGQPIHNNDHSRYHSDSATELLVRHSASLFHVALKKEALCTTAITETDTENAVNVAQVIRPMQYEYFTVMVNNTL